MPLREMMPILMYPRERKQHPECPQSIPMSMLNEEWADRNHHQTLDRLAQRGGLGPDEALAIMDKRRWHHMDMKEAVAELNRRVSACQ